MYKKHLFLSLLLVCISHFILSAQTEKVFSFDESQEEEVIEQRSFDVAKLDVYKLQKDFQYEEAKFEETRLERIWRELKERFFNGLNEGMDSKAVAYTLIGLMVFGLAWFLLRTTTNKFVQNSGQDNMRYVEELDIRVDENILLERMAAAENKSEWRDAIRFAYLLNLKAMNEKDKILWREYKLSSDYLEELNDNSLKTAFTSMTSYFNYSWYGNRTLDAEMYAEVKQQYQELDQLITKS